MEPSVEAGSKVEADEKSLPPVDLPKQAQSAIAGIDDMRL